MSGLRERQKAERDDRILTAAAELFRAGGYDGTKIEAIAQHADVSPGTIYNYYENKGDLLVAIVAMEVNEVLAAGSRLLANPPGQAALAVDKLFAIYLEHSLVYLSKEMWRHAMAISTQQPDSRFGRSYSELDQHLSDQVCTLIGLLQAAGAIREDVDATAAGQMLFNTLNMMFIGFVKDEDMPLAELKRQIGRQTRVFLIEIGAKEPE